MKKLSYLLITLFVILIVIPAMALLYFWISNLLYLGGTNEANVNYLSKHKQELVLTQLEVTADKEMFDAAFYENQVFLLGESHGFADVQGIDQALFIHLNKKTGLRYYIAEIDSTRAGHLNTFLSGAKKDSSLLRQFVLDIKQRIPQQSSQELYQKWSALYDYNQGLADSLKIEVLGLDMPFDAEVTTISRDSIMLLNFQKLVAEKGLEEEKFYGLFGYTHVLQSPINKSGFRPFAAKLKKANMGMSNKIKSIVCYNLDSDVYLPKTPQMPTPDDEKTSLLNVDGPIVMVNGINDPKEVTAENTITLFNLEAESSPYRKSQYLAGVEVNLFGGSILPSSAAQTTTDFFQYMILIRNSKALTKFN